VENKGRVERDEFRNKLKEEWKLMWKERFDDRVKAEGVVIRDYPLIFMDRGSVVFASRDAKTPTFNEIVEFWAARGSIYAPEPTVGGWGKFVRTKITNSAPPRARSYAFNQSSFKEDRQQTKKSGKGWLHIE